MIFSYYFCKIIIIEKNNNLYIYIVTRFQFILNFNTETKVPIVNLITLNYLFF